MRTSFSAIILWIATVGLLVPMGGVLAGGEDTVELEPGLDYVGRSAETEDAVLVANSPGGKAEEALSLPLDPDQPVFDNGTYTPEDHRREVDDGLAWMSWPHYGEVEVRRVSANFTLPVPSSAVETVQLMAPHYEDASLHDGVVLPVNNNVYVFANGEQIARRGTSYDAVKTSGFWEVEGWVADGDLGAPPENALEFGSNTLDLVFEESALWGGAPRLELRLEVHPVETEVSAEPYVEPVVDPIGVYGAEASARLVVEALDAPLPGRPIHFTANGASVCQAVTDSEGWARCQAGPQGTLAMALEGGYEATFPGATALESSSDWAPLLTFQGQELP